MFKNRNVSVIKDEVTSEAADRSMAAFCSRVVGGLWM